MCRTEKRHNWRGAARIAVWRAFCDQASNGNGLIDRLVARDGDVGWGLAYHPRPASRRHDIQRARSVAVYLFMAEQFSLAGFDEPAAPTDRLFFALYPDQATAQRIALTAQSLRARCALKGKPLEPERLHITLHHLGDTVGVPAQVVAAATQAAAGLSASASAFDVVFEHAESFAGRSGNRPFVLRGEAGLADLRGFQQALGVAMARAGLGRWVETRFTPHVTLLYDDQLVGTQAIEPIAWRVNEFVLVHSLLGRHRHEMLGRWPLPG